MRPLWLAAAALAVALSSARAEAPELKAFHPIGAARGTTNAVSLSGKFNPWPPQFWSDPPGLVFKPETNKNKVTIEIPAHASPGPRLVRVYNEDGASDPKFFVIGDGREVQEQEPNNRLAEAIDPGELPTVVSGRLDKNDDVDCYRIALAEGAWIEASLRSHTLMSKVDAVLRLVTTNGVTLAWNHDFATFDPQLRWQAPSNQTVILQVFGFAYPANSDIRLAGGDEAFYRLRLGNSAPAGWKDSNEPSPALPLEVAATIGVPGEEDRYPFEAKQDQFVDARVIAAGLGSPLDARLRILDASGKQLAENDDADGSRDPRLEWKASAGTNFILAVASTPRRGSSNHQYRLAAKVAPPDFHATWAANSLTLKPGETNNLKLNLKRLRDHTNELTGRFENLPPGLSATLTNFPAKSGDVEIPITAAADAPTFQGPIRLLILDALEKAEKPVLVELTERGENNGVPNGYGVLAIESLPDLWLTIKSQAVQVASTNK